MAGGALRQRPPACEAQPDKAYRGLQDGHDRQKSGDRKLQRRRGARNPRNAGGDNPLKGRAGEGGSQKRVREADGHAAARRTRARTGDGRPVGLLPGDRRAGQVCRHTGAGAKKRLHLGHRNRLHMVGRPGIDRALRRRRQNHPDTGGYILRGTRRRKRLLRRPQPRQHTGPALYPDCPEKRGGGHKKGGPQKQAPRIRGAEHPAGRRNRLHGGRAEQKRAARITKSDRADQVLEGLLPGRHRICHQGGACLPQGGDTPRMGAGHTPVPLCQDDMGAAAGLRLRRERDYLPKPQPDSHKPHDNGQRLGGNDDGMR